MTSRILSSLRSASTALRTASAALTQRLEGKQLVGKDNKGNAYYVDSKNPSKRFVEYAGKDLLGDSATVPMSWYSWLRHTRATPPTPDELEQEARNTAALAAKVAALKAADAKLRMQEIAEKAMNNGDSSSFANASMERDQRGGVSSWSTGAGGAGMGTGAGKK